MTPHPRLPAFTRMATIGRTSVQVPGHWSERRWTDLCRAESARLNFTNEGGVGGTICFLRNVNGLWLQDQCIETWKRDRE